MLGTASYYSEPVYLKKGGDMWRNARFMFRTMLWIPIIVGCVLLVYLFPPYRRGKLSAKANEETSQNPLSKLQTALADDILMTRKT